MIKQQQQRQQYTMHTACRKTIQVEWRKDSKMNFISIFTKERKDEFQIMNSMQWTDNGLNIVCVCICVWQGKYEYKSFI